MKLFCPQALEVNGGGMRKWANAVELRGGPELHLSGQVIVSQVQGGVGFFVCLFEYRLYFLEQF